MASGKRSRGRNPALASLPELPCLFQVDLDFPFPLPRSLLEGPFQGHGLLGPSGLFTGIMCGLSKLGWLGGGRGTEGEPLSDHSRDSRRSCSYISLTTRDFDPPPDPDRGRGPVPLAGMEAQVETAGQGGVEGELPSPASLPAPFPACLQGMQKCQLSPSCSVANPINPYEKNRLN